MIENAHPVEELHSLRAQIARMQSREAEIEQFLLAGAGPAERVGMLHYARPETRRARVLDPELLPRNVLEEEGHYRLEETTRVVVENLPPELIEPMEGPVIGMRWASKRSNMTAPPIDAVAHDVGVETANKPQEDAAFIKELEAELAEDIFAAEHAFFDAQQDLVQNDSAQDMATQAEEPPFACSMPATLAQTFTQPAQVSAAMG